MHDGVKRDRGWQLLHCSHYANAISELRCYLRAARQYDYLPTGLQELAHKRPTNQTSSTRNQYGLNVLIGV